MGRFSGVWEWLKKITGTTLIVCLCLWGIRCAVKQQVVDYAHFERFMHGLVHYIFS
jgi:hypothetical protein